MTDWKSALSKLRTEPKKTILRLPAYFNFKDHDAYDFDKALKFFQWEIHDSQVVIDFSDCKSANYQALSLLVLYAWRLKSNGCRVEFVGLDENGNGGAADVWRMMGSPGLFGVCFNENQNFRSNEHKPLVAIRNHADFKMAMERATEFSKEFNVEYINTLRYVISELLYNTLEHGIAHFEDGDSRNKRLPSIIQFTWYMKRDEIHFIVGDVGVGVLRHLSQAHPELEDDIAALQKSIQPKVSGTFGRSDPYQAKNNAGMGLYISSNIIRRLRADMHIVSGNGLLHISPSDITTRVLEYSWPGTFVLVSIRLEKSAGFDLHSLMTEFRSAAIKEQDASTKAESENTLYLSIYNHFGTYPEDKSAAISYRDKKLIPALNDGKKVLIDFGGVESSPHSFLSALLATPFKRLGMAAYKRIKYVNAATEIRETIDFILDDSTGDDSLDSDQQ